MMIKSRAMVAGAVLFTLGFIPALSVVQQRPPGTEHDGPAFTFNKIAEGVYHAVGTGSMSVGANSTVIINQDEVMLVDNHASPAAATVLLEELKAITDKPVKYVVDTHYHFDHAHGAQIFGPDVTIIGSEFTRRALLAGDSRGGKTWPRFVGTIPQQIAALQAQIDTAKAPDTKAALQRRLKIQEQYKLATDVVRPTPPTVTLEDRITLFRGGREIDIRFIGRAHTGGDVVVFLPQEKILIGGDLVSTNPSNLGDGYAGEWIQTLENLKKLDFTILLPGHGPALKDRAPIDSWEDYLKDFWAQVQELKKQGVSVDDAAKRIDMRKQAAHYPSITSAGVDRDAVLGAYEVLDGLR